MLTCTQMSSDFAWAWKHMCFRTFRIYLLILVWNLYYWPLRCVQRASTRLCWNYKFTHTHTLICVRIPKILSQLFKLWLHIFYRTFALCSTKFYEILDISWFCGKYESISRINEKNSPFLDSSYHMNLLCIKIWKIRQRSSPLNIKNANEHELPEKIFLHSQHTSFYLNIEVIIPISILFS